MRRQWGRASGNGKPHRLMKNTTAITIGLDLGDKAHAICVLDDSGEVIDKRMITNHVESLRRLAKKYPGARIAMEVGT